MNKSLMIAEPSFKKQFIQMKPMRCIKDRLVHFFK